ncbi:MAG: 50S ribosomal protein L10 [Sandaracinaceae bacterium]|nr:50S ribosomal protein L10 [Sandaracinaceae bacterium]
MATRTEKASVVDEVKERFDRAKAVVLVNFTGIDVLQITELRNRFREAGVEYKVVKNRLIKKALEGKPVASNATLGKALKGMTGVAWSYEDPSAAAKIIKQFRKEAEANEKLEFKCGLLENDVFDAKRVENELANLPGKDELRGMLLAQLLAPMQQLVMQLNAPAQNLGFALDARRRQLEEAG